MVWISNSPPWTISGSSWKRGNSTALKVGFLGHNSTQSTSSLPLYTRSPFTGVFTIIQCVKHDHMNVNWCFYLFTPVSTSLHRRLPFTDVFTMDACGQVVFYISSSWVFETRLCILTTSLLTTNTPLSSHLFNTIWFFSSPDYKSSTATSVRLCLLVTNHECTPISFSFRNTSVHISQLTYHNVYTRVCVFACARSLFP